MPVQGDGDQGEAQVDSRSAVGAWAQAAHDVLAEAASRQRTIQYAALAREVQRRSGVQTNQPVGAWIGPLLGMLARQCQAKGLPILPALAVRRDGTVGPAYDEILRYAHVQLDEDREEHALRQRELAHRTWAGARPAVVGESRGATVSPAVKATSPAPKPVARRTTKPEPLQGNVCPRCFMQMSLTGVCDNCD